MISGDLYPHVIGNLQGDKGVGEAFNLSMDASGCHNRSTLFKVVQESLVTLGLFLLRADEEKVEDRKDQDQRDKTGKYGPPRPASRVLSVSKIYQKKHLLLSFVFIIIFLCLEESSAEGCKPVFMDCLPHLFHQRKVEMEVMNGVEPCRENLPGHVEVTEIRP